MSNWGSEGFILNLGSSGINNLRDAVGILPANVKQAFYAAAMKKGVIHRGTWNGCAFNAGGLEIGNIFIDTYQKAMDVFGVSKFVVSQFISKWDSSPYNDDVEATKALVGMLEEVGLFSDPESFAEIGPRKRVVMEVVYEGNLGDAELLASFKDQINNINIDSEFGQLVEAASVLVS